MYTNIERELFPSEQQLVNYLKYKRKQASMKTRLNLGDLEKWCLAHSNIPDDLDEMFVKRSFTVVPKTHKVLHSVYVIKYIIYLFFICFRFCITFYSQQRGC